MSKKAVPVSCSINPEPEALHQEQRGKFGWLFKEAYTAKDKKMKLEKEKEEVSDHRMGCGYSVGVCCSGGQMERGELRG